jgi:8-amino-7-oxononanoate synthase
MTPLTEFEAHLAASLEKLRGDGLLRQMRLPQGIDLVSNDYLGFADHPYIKERIREGLSDVPAGSGGSRLLRGHHQIFEEAQYRLAAVSGSEAALLFGSGYAANIGLLQAIGSPDDLILSDELNHASLIDGIRLSKARTVVYPHRDLDALEAALKLPRTGRAIVITESVFSMDGDVAPLTDMVGLAERYGAVMVVDEAHATGLYGGRGSGRVEEHDLRDRVLATVHTGGKALGSGGAWVACSHTLRDVMVNRARAFIFSTAPMPILAIALMAGVDLLQRETGRPVDVHRKSALLREKLAALGVRAAGDSPIVPIIVGANEVALQLQAALAAAGFDVRAIRPPSVAPGTARLRVTVRYPVSDVDLLRFAEEVSRLMGSGPRTVRASDCARALTQFS